MKFKTIAIMSLLLITVMLNIAKADYSDYTIDMKVLPDNGFENTGALVFGYITISDWSKIVPVNTLHLRIQEGSEIKKDLSYNELNYVNDIDNNNYLVDGFFYAQIDDLPAGNYIAILSLGGEDVKVIRFKINAGNSNLKLNYITFTDNQGPILQFDYSGASAPLDANLYLYGRKNFNNPVIETYSIGSGITDVPDRTNFVLSDYVGDNEVLGMVVYAETTDGQLAKPTVIVRHNGVKLSNNEAEVALSSADLKKGAETDIPFTITNQGLLPASFSLSLTGSLKDYAAVINEVTVNPGETYNDVIRVNLPRKLSLLTGSLGLSVESGSELIASAESDYDLLAADPVHEVIINSTVLTKSFYYSDENVKGYLSIINDGDYDEVLDLTYGFEGSDEYNMNGLYIPKGSSKEVNFVLPSVDNADLVFTISNEYVNYQKIVNVNVEPRINSFRFYIENDHLIAHNELTKNITFKLENTGNTEDLFALTSDYAYYELDNVSNVVFLKPGEQIEINSTISLPLNSTLLTANFTVCSQNGNECKNDTLIITIFNTGSLINTVAETTVNVTSTQSNNEIVYQFDVTNNNLLAKTYELVYDTNNSDIELTAYPSSTFIIQPGETHTVYLYADSESDLSGQEVTYAIKEDGKELVNDSLIITPMVSSSMTGFAVAVGSVLGVAGLVVLVLFIYFYFIKQPPQGGDEEFKPVEVKKADLTNKPDVKNETKYW